MDIEYDYIKILKFLSEYAKQISSKELLNAMLDTGITEH